MDEWILAGDAEFLERGAASAGDYGAQRRNSCPFDAQHEHSEGMVLSCALA